MATKITFKTKDYSNIRSEFVADEHCHPMESFRQPEAFSPSAEIISHYGKHISITSPSDSRSTSPNLNELLANRESAARNFIALATEKPGSEFSQNEPDKCKITHESDKTDLFQEAPVKLPNKFEDQNETTSLSATLSPQISPSSPSSASSSSASSTSLNSSASSFVLLSEYNSFKKKKPSPLGKRALLKKLSEGTLVRRQSERHHQTPELSSALKGYPSQMLSPRQQRASGTSDFALPKRKSANLYKKKYPQPIEFLNLEALRRYRKVYKLSIRPTASKSSLLRVAMDHYSKMNPDPNQIIFEFICALHSDNNCN
ncbi:hypothetical protein MDAP_001474 [Mitosporidium daphniae]|uniref:Histone deacetylase complex subunit SAP30 Sin3 binding domain-containing protein n=1 Tax=Mitosporidium daphniae TaxID=1485682 RepID=A0A098VMW7_9MICR|nr:uncharacterized protein DI09_74p50 [Mitosporidium daphniae]KGG50363.1 hypothetical protein DI09_74p50 [Mitosporidium daphniae]|eukprot:XP_013236804.1 uncharacterized protein DI09_74p50 [Mitosporidium daphniae]